MADKIPPLRLAVIFDQQIRSGGGYQQALNAALITKELPEQCVQTVFFTTLEENVCVLASHGIQAELLEFSLFQKLRAYLRHLTVHPRLLNLVKKLERYSPFEKKLIQRKIDLVYFLAPSEWTRDLEETNFICTVWDLAHRDDPEFPEVRWNKQFEMREKSYRSLLPRAVAIFVDSDLGKRNVICRYGIDDCRVYVIPFQAATETRQTLPAGQQALVDVHEKYNLNVSYVFYPAQFWAHKNHIYLLAGLRVLEERYGLRVGAIFSGGDQGNLAHVKSYVSKMNLEERVRFVGFVDNEEIPELYRQSVALVMPSYFGPTNLPPLEAFKLGIPVLYSDKAGLRDQVGEAALLLDLRNPGSLADHLNNLINNPLLRDKLIEAGKERLRYFDGIDRVGIFTQVLEEFRARRATWPS